MRVRSARRGFTLVEVALAVAVGLIIIGGAVLGYGAVKNNASNANARDKILGAQSVVEEYASSNGGNYPASVAAGGQFSTMWSKKRPDDYALSPWGGPAGASGVYEIAPITGGTSPSASGSTTPVPATAPVANSTTNQSDIIYGSFTSAGLFGNIQAFSTSAYVPVKGYFVSIFDQNGNALWDVKGGK